MKDQAVWRIDQISTISSSKICHWRYTWSSYLKDGEGHYYFKGNHWIPTSAFYMDYHLWSDGWRCNGRSNLCAAWKMDHNKYVRYIMYHPFQPQEHVIQVMWMEKQPKIRSDQGTWPSWTALGAIRIFATNKTWGKCFGSKFPWRSHWAFDSDVKYMKTLSENRFDFRAEKIVSKKDGTKLYWKIFERHQARVIF